MKLQGLGFRVLGYPASGEGASRAHVRSVPQGKQGFVAFLGRFGALEGKATGSVGGSRVDIPQVATTVQGLGVWGCKLLVCKMFSSTMQIHPSLSHLASRL